MQVLRALFEIYFFFSFLALRFSLSDNAGCLRTSFLPLSFLPLSPMLFLQVNLKEHLFYSFVNIVRNSQNIC